MTDSKCKSASERPKQHRIITEAQREAQKKNWTILRLRGLYAQVPRDIPEQNYTNILREIDRALIKLGAESETARREQIREAIEKGDYAFYSKVRSFKGLKNNRY